ncbi:glycosyltransferase family 2 protein [Jannaschia seohaensis]|uniref:Glycosyl transferase family 2 n=1 Tax=Jannaschia seohaensis TaxID=475081 RepID=A0A2Y9A6N2_9RHOB|nr:glycosyltransferase family 2 protein [Jannaschia seohaensis]PWJ21981.1 glycosyl transferase family 2 [Jannaschia seohaensis]SSA38259.1 Glycosyl transferase family 2 [Jannaschia seohaensis]
MRPTHSDVLDSLEIASGTLRSGAPSILSMMRDEMHFLPAWLDHHRRIGVAQFVVLDDGSGDGTAELLAAQPDVVMLRSRYGYGDPADGRGPLGFKRAARAGVVMKDAIAQKFLWGRHALYVDADEFLLPPAEAPDLPAILDVLRAERRPTVAASLVEFFPERLPPPGTPAAPPGDFDALLAECPYFEAHPLLRLRPFRQPQQIALAKSSVLWDRYVREKIPEADRPPLSRHSTLKTPIVRRSRLVWRYGSHKANWPPPTDRLLTVAHFVFTSALPAKIDKVLAHGGHNHGGASYKRFAALVQAMRAEDASFLTERSERYVHPDQLKAAGLMLWR